jgi:hypothetical protein
MAALTRTDSTSVVQLHMPPYNNVVQEDSQSSIIEEKIRRVCSNCMLRIDEEQGLYCRSCVVLLPSDHPDHPDQSVAAAQHQPRSRNCCTWGRIAKLTIGLGTAAFIIYILGRGFGYCSGPGVSCPPDQTWDGWW